MPDPHHQEPRTSGTTSAFEPTRDQLTLLRRLIQQRGTTLPWPHTRAQADRAIQRLTGATR